MAGIDWEALAKQVGSLKADGESGGDQSARRALELLLGEEKLCEAVDYYISGRPGSELVRSVLWLLHPWSAMKYCYDIYKSDTDINRRRFAVELIRVVADRRALAWVREFLDDDDEGIQMWGVGVLDQLLYKEWVSGEEAEGLIVKAETHTNANVRETAQFIRSFLVRRGDSEADSQSHAE